MHQLGLHLSRQSNDIETWMSRRCGALPVAFKQMSDVPCISAQVRVQRTSMRLQVTLLVLMFDFAAESVFANSEICQLSFASLTSK